MFGEYISTFIYFIKRPYLGEIGNIIQVSDNRVLNEIIDRPDTREFITRTV